MYFIDALSGACDKVVFEVRESLRRNIGVFMRFQACGGIPQAFFVGRMVIAWRRGGCLGVVEWVGTWRLGDVREMVCGLGRVCFFSLCCGTG